MPAAAAGFFFKADRFNGQAAIKALAHVVDRQGRDADRRQRFHLNAGASGDVNDGFDGQRGIVGTAEIDSHGVER